MLYPVFITTFPSAWYVLTVPSRPELIIYAEHGLLILRDVLDVLKVDVPASTSTHSFFKAFALFPCPPLWYPGFLRLPSTPISLAFNSILNVAMRISGMLTGTLAMLGLAVSWTDARAYTPRSSRTLGGLLARQAAAEVCAMVNGPWRVSINGVLVNVGTISTSGCA